MNILIVEDEHHAVKRLTSLLNNILEDLNILATIDSVEDAVNWFKNNASPDLIFMDVQLADDVSFSIFKEVEIDAPIIFTTAYDQYSLKAFKVNSIDYLLKPLDEEELKQAIAKYQKLTKQEIAPDLKSLTNLINQIGLKKEYRNRFLLKSGEKYTFLLSDEIAYFYSEDSLTFMVTNGGKTYNYDDTLGTLEAELDPKRFFRINRRQIVHLESIKKIHTYFNSRMKLDLLPKGRHEQEAIVSREKVKDFKNWLGA